MLEYEFFLSLFTEDDLRSFAKGLGVNGWGKTPAHQIPYPLLKRQIKDAFAGNLKKQKPINVRAKLTEIGNATIKKYGLPKLTGEELLVECATRVDIPEPKLIAYLYVCDEDLYIEKITYWLENSKGEGHLFEQYFKEMTEDEYLLRMFKSERFLEGKFPKIVLEKLKDIEIPKDITIEEIIKQKIPNDKSGKMLYKFLESKDGKKHPFYKELANGIATWAVTKERDIAVQTLLEINKHNKEIEDKNSDLERNLLRLQDKFNKTNQTVADQLTRIKMLELKNRELTTQVSAITKDKEGVLYEKKCYRKIQKFWKKKMQNSQNN